MGEARHVAQGDPQVALPFQQADALVILGHQRAPGFLCAMFPRVAQGGQGFMSEPATQAAILGMAETAQGAVKRGFAKHLHRLCIALTRAEDHRAHLVVIHQPADPLRVAVPHQQAELLGADPGLAVDHHATQGRLWRISNKGA